MDLVRRSVLARTVPGVNGEEAIELINQARELLVRAFGVEGRDFLMEVRPHTATLVWKGRPPVVVRSEFPV